MVSARLRAFYSPLIGFLPQLGLAGLLLVGGRQAIAGTISIGDFVAFYGYVLLLTGPMRMLGIALGMAQRAVASGPGCSRCSTASRGSSRWRIPRRCPRAAGAWSSAT